MGGITCNAEGFAGETGVVNVLEGGERDTNDLLSCSHYPLLHSDAASNFSLDGQTKINASSERERCPA